MNQEENSIVTLNLFQGRRGDVWRLQPCDSRSSPEWQPVLGLQGAAKIKIIIINNQF